MLLSLEPVHCVSILMGADNYWKLITGEYVGITDNLVVINTKFGWIIYGLRCIIINLITVLDLIAKIMSKYIIKRFWHLDVLSIVRGDNFMKITT